MQLPEGVLPKPIVRVRPHETKDAVIVKIGGVEFMLRFSDAIQVGVIAEAEYDRRKKLGLLKQDGGDKHGQRRFV